jgi:hypothetical protein
MRTILVSGALANKPSNGGNAWSRLSWILGFRRLGFEVYFVEQIGKADCRSGAGTVSEFEESVNLTYFRAITEQFGLSGRSSLIYADGETVFGVPLVQLADAAKHALLFNIGGHLANPQIRQNVARSLYYDDDPGFTQFWHAAGYTPRDLRHDCYFTIGENIGTAGCMIPTNGIHWRHTRPPVVLQDWPVATGSFDRFTTVASWRGAYAPVEYRGRTYGVKAHEFRKFIEVPGRGGGTKFEIALQIDAADKKDLDCLIANRWQVVDPIRAAGSPTQFQQYVQNSGAEFSVAQNIYVDTNSGWFSDRTVRYLASGKPVLIEDSGFSRHIPVGEGLVAFRTVDEAIDGAARIVRDYDRHCTAARRLAEEFFDSDKVICRLAAEAGLDLPS